MPWQTPALKDVRQTIRDYVQGSLPGADASVPNSILRVASDAQGGLCHLNLQYLDWQALQLLPDTAETEWLDRHADIWLTNADGSTGRKLASYATGTVTFTGVAGAIVPAATQLGNSQCSYETLADVTLAAGGAATPGDVRALDPGTIGNLDPGMNLQVSTTIGGIDPTAVVVTLGGGTDEETDDELRARILRRIQQPPMGGAAGDYEAWALAVPGVTRAWAATNMGLGTATVRFLMDALRASDDGWPTPDDIAQVAGYIDTVRPVTVKDCYVVAPIKTFLDITIADLVPADNANTQAEIEQSLRAMLFERAAPGATIFASWISYAIMSAASVVSFTLVTNTDFVMPSPGNMAVLGNIIYE
jgi:uncharacterized phage protein gp47/JayE